jgi:hypothetical protein
MVTSTEAEAPLNTNDNNIIHKTLEPPIVRNQFNRTIQCYKVLNNTKTTIDILQNSLKSNIIPPTFKLKNTFYNNNEVNNSKIDNILKQTSKTIIKITIDSLNEKENNLFSQHLEALHSLLNLIQDPKGKDAILNKLSFLESNLRQQTMKKSIQKLQWLKKKQQKIEDNLAHENVMKLCETSSNFWEPEP